MYLLDLLHQKGYPIFDHYYDGIPLSTPSPYKESLLIVLMGLMLTLAIIYLSSPKITVSKFISILAINPGHRLRLREHGFTAPIRAFLWLQTITLCSVLIEYAYAYLYSPASTTTVYWQRIGIIAGLIIGIYILSILYYKWIGYCYVPKEKQHLWFINYYMLLSLWGLTLYIPILLSLLTSIAPKVILGLGLTLYVGFRLFLMMRTSRIFLLNIQRSLHLILYLCGREIVPYLFLGFTITYL